MTLFEKLPSKWETVPAEFDDADSLALRIVEKMGDKTKGCLVCDDYITCRALLPIRADLEPHAGETPLNLRFLHFNDMKFLDHKSEDFLEKTTVST